MQITEGDSKELFVICVYNFDAGINNMSRMAAVLHDMANEHEQRPHHRRALLIGDVNFSAAERLGTQEQSAAARCRSHA